MTVKNIAEELIKEFALEHEENLKTKNYYQVFQDAEIVDYSGGEEVERVSIFKFSFFSVNYLTAEEAVKYAEKHYGNWECFILEPEIFIEEGNSFVMYSPPPNSSHLKSWNKIVR